RPRQCPLYPLLPGAYPPIPVPPRPLRGGWLRGSAPPLLYLRERGGGPAPAGDARTRPEPPLARGARTPDRVAGDGCDRDPRLLRAAQGMARRTEPRTPVRVVRRGR